MINNTELAEKYKGYFNITTVYHPMFDTKLLDREYKFMTAVSKEALSKTEAIFLDGELYMEYNEEQNKLVKV